MAAWQRTRDATALWLRHRGVIAIPIAPLVFARYALSPLAAVRALSDGCNAGENPAQGLAHDDIGDHTRGADAVRRVDLKRMTYKTIGEVGHPGGSHGRHEDG